MQSTMKSVMRYSIGAMLVLSVLFAFCQSAALPTESRVRRAANEAHASSYNEADVGFMKWALGVLGNPYFRECLRLKMAASRENPDLTDAQRFAVLQSNMQRCMIVSLRA